MRLHDWQSRLAAVITEKQRASFAWGVNDCCLFVCDCINAVTGIDPAEPFRGRYETPVGGYALIEEFSGGGIEALVEKMAEIHGYVEIAPTFAQRGDLGLYKDADAGDALSINVGPNYAALKRSGLVMILPSQISRAWRIG